MAAAYPAGAGRRHLPPFTLFLPASRACFAAPPLDDFALPLIDRSTLKRYSGAAKMLVEEGLSARGVEPDAPRAVFEARQDRPARSLILPHIPLIAAGLGVLQAGRRRPVPAAGPGEGAAGDRRGHRQQHDPPGLLFGIVFAVSRSSASRPGREVLLAAELPEIESQQRTVNCSNSVAKSEMGSVLLNSRQLLQIREISFSISSI